MKFDYVPAVRKDRSFVIHAHHTAYRNISETMFGWNEAEQDKFAAKAFDQGGIKNHLVTPPESGCRRMGAIPGSRLAERIVHLAIRTIQGRRKRSHKTHQEHR